MKLTSFNTLSHITCTLEQSKYMLPICIFTQMHKINIQKHKEFLYHIILSPMLIWKILSHNHPLLLNT